LVLKREIAGFAKEKKMAKFGTMLFVFIITAVLFLVGGMVAFRFMESTMWTAIVIGWGAILVTFTIFYLRSDQPKLPYFLGLVVGCILFMVEKGLLQL
jgi:uncharacterized membrane protein